MIPKNTPAARDRQEAEKKARCRRCGRILKNPEAIALGMGRICAAKSSSKSTAEAPPAHSPPDKGPAAPSPKPDAKPAPSPQPEEAEYVEEAIVVPPSQPAAPPPVPAECSKQADYPRANPDWEKERCTEPQRKKLWAMAKAAGYDEVKLKDLVFGKYGCESTASLTKGQIQALFEYLENEGGR